MKRYIVTGYLDHKVIAYLFESERELVDAYDLQAWALKLKEVVGEIDLRPWNDCACKTCQNNIALQGKALRLLGEVL